MDQNIVLETIVYAKSKCALHFQIDGVLLYIYLNLGT
jgi:hypothetical protein